MTVTAFVLSVRKLRHMPFREWDRSDREKTAVHPIVHACQWQGQFHLVEIAPQCWMHSFSRSISCNYSSHIYLQVHH